MLAELQAEADALYRPRGAQLPLNLALRTYDAAKKRIAQLATTSDKWLEVERQIEDARGELARLRAERAALFEERERARATASAARSLDSARARLVEIEAALAATNAELEAIDAPAELLARAQAIADLQERLGSHRKAQLDRPRIAAELEAIEERARRAERDVPKGAEPSGTVVDAHVRKLALDAASLRERTRQIESREAELASVVERTEERLAALRPAEDSSVLRDALDSARREGDVEARLAAAERRASRDRSEAEARTRALGGFSGTLEELAVLAVPPSDVVASHAREAAARAERTRAAADRRRKLEEERADIERGLAALRAEGDVPTEEVLARARAERDALWEAVKGGASAEAGRYERAVRAADELADRLRREASRVSRSSELTAGAQALARKLELATEEARALESDAARQARAWDALWRPAGVSGAPDEMVAWLARHEVAVAAASRALEAAKDVDALAADSSRARSPLAATLGAEAEGKSLAELERAASRALAALEKRAKERETLERTLEGAREERDRIARERAACNRDRAAWATQWASCTRSLGLGEGASPEEVTAAMEALGALARAGDDLEKARRRLDGIDRDAARFADDVRAVAAACAPDLAARSPDDACAELARRLAAAADRRARKETLEEQRRKQTAQAADARAAVEARAAAPGASESAAAAEARATELDAVVAELDNRIQQTSRHLGGVETGAKQFDQSPAVEQAAEAQRQLARVRNLVEHYARVRLAGAAVARVLERYRKENQGPVLARASELFSMLTLGSFESLEVGFGESDEPVLVAVRDGRRLETSALSDGTLDQLYLALRVASLERLTESRGPLPLLLDDVLVHFDNQRAAAALAVLAELAKRTQVILFTHHARVVDLARRAVSDRDGAAAPIHDLAAI